MIGGYLGAFGLALAQAVFPNPPHIETITPPCITRGTSVVLDIRGSRLSDASFFVSGKGMSLGAPQPAPGGVRVRLTAAKDAAVGTHDIKAASKFGVSGPAVIWTGVFPQREEREPNDDPSQPEALPLGISSIYGVLGRPGDRDCFSFEAMAGDSWALSLVYRGLRSGLQKPSLEIRDASGSVRTFEPQFLHDLATTLKAEHAGRYVVTVKSDENETGLRCGYLLTVGKAPFVESFVPGGEKPGRTVGLDIAGANLGKTTRAKISIPVDAEYGSWHSIQTENGPSLPFLYPTTAMPAIAATESDQTMALPRIPCALEGKFEAYSKARFTFEGRQGDHLGFELFVRGSASIASVVLFGPDGRPVNSSAGRSKRTTLLFERLPTTGQYVAEIESGRAGSGTQLPYRLVVEREEPGVRLSTWSDGLVVVAGHSAALPVTVGLAGGFRGDFEVVTNRLPTGVTVSRRIQRVGPDSCIVVTAGRDALPGAFALNLSAKYFVDGVKVVRPLRIKPPLETEDTRSWIFPLVVTQAPISGRK
jgi:hypothetical protein